MPVDKCLWAGHQAAMDEAGFCGVCQEGEVDRDWAFRNGETELLSVNNQPPTDAEILAVFELDT